MRADCAARGTDRCRFGEAAYRGKRVGNRFEGERTDLGFAVVGPFGTTAEAEVAADDPNISAAILDINLGGKLVYPVAEALRMHGVPFAFITGYGAESVDPRFAEAPVLQKPVDRNALRSVLNRSATSVR